MMLPTRVIASERVSQLGQADQHQRINIRTDLAPTYKYQVAFFPIVLLAQVHPTRHCTQWHLCVSFLKTLTLKAEKLLSTAQVQIALARKVD